MYYLDAAGKMVTGKKKIDGITYLFDENGVFVKAIDLPSNRVLGKKVVRYAKKWVGVTPYVPASQRWTGSGYYNSLKKGTDCSGFVHLIYEHFGYDLPYSSVEYQYNVGIKIKYDQMIPGDIVVFGYGSHVGIYAGNGMMVHCANPEDGTMYGIVYEKPTACIRVLK